MPHRRKNAHHRYWSQRRKTHHQIAMISPVRIILGFGCCAWLFAAAIPARAAAAEVTDQQSIDGRALAQRLKNMRPIEQAQLTGLLKTRDAKGRRVEWRAEFRTEVTATNWTSWYGAFRNPNINAATDTVVVIHAPGSPVHYRAAAAAVEPKNLAGPAAMIPFAESDFWLTDLGLEFFQWPAQRVIKRELRRGEACTVLESTNPNPSPGTYKRVVCWIDNDTLGVVHADAYDHRDKLLKEFSPKRFKKIEGQWQLQEMEMRNVQTDTRTAIFFDVNAAPKP